MTDVIFFCKEYGCVKFTEKIVVKNILTGLRTIFTCPEGHDTEFILEFAK